MTKPRLMTTQELSAIWAIPPRTLLGLKDTLLTGTWVKIPHIRGIRWDPAAVEHKFLSLNHQSPLDSER